MGSCLSRSGTVFLALKRRGRGAGESLNQEEKVALICWISSLSAGAAGL